MFNLKEILNNPLNDFLEILNNIASNINNELPKGVALRIYDVSNEQINAYSFVLVKMGMDNLNLIDIIYNPLNLSYYSLDEIDHPIKKSKKINNVDEIENTIIDIFSNDDGIRKRIKIWNETKILYK